ncbi:MAG: hypothetical protein ABI553_10525 [Chloroflexota bacterium]
MSTPARGMRDPEAFKVRPPVLEGTDGVGGEATGYGSMEPERLTLVPVQSGSGRDPARECNDLTPAKTSLFRTPLTRQQPSIAQIDDMLSR